MRLLTGLAVVLAVYSMSPGRHGRRISSRLRSRAAMLRASNAALTFQPFANHFGPL